jgi:hypothetical protein
VTLLPWRFGKDNLSYGSVEADPPSTYLLLQQAQVVYLESKHLGPSHPDTTKARMALHYSRRMAWDMVRESLQKVGSEEELAQVPFARLFFVMRAAVAVFETKKYGEEIQYGDTELRDFSKILEWFAARWSVGGKW